MTIPIYQVDAFATEIFKGNPAAVVPLTQWIPDDLMQQIAMENNLSETVFFVRDAAAGNSQYHIRWFTPDYEIDLCGHATLAAAYIIKKVLEPAVSEIHFTTQKAGPLQTLINNDIFTLNFPARMPLPAAVPDGLLESIGVSETLEVLRSRDYFVVLPDEAAVLAVTPDYNKMKALDTVGVIVTARGTQSDAVSRCFYPGAGVPEDPVTGSAHCNIVPYWAQQLGKTNLFCRQLSARSGDLQCELKGDRVYMSGRCVLYLKGELYLHVVEAATV
jgi:PhzF family phenazine biosynthesis protein